MSSRKIRQKINTITEDEREQKNKPITHTVMIEVMYVF